MSRQGKRCCCNPPLLDNKIAASELTYRLFSWNSCKLIVSSLITELQVIRVAKYHMFNTELPSDYLGCGNLQIPLVLTLHRPNALPRCRPRNAPNPAKLRRPHTHPHPNQTIPLYPHHSLLYPRHLPLPTTPITTQHHLTLISFGGARRKKSEGGLQETQLAFPPHKKGSLQTQLPPRHHYTTARTTSTSHTRYEHPRERE